MNLSKQLNFVGWYQQSQVLMPILETYWFYMKIKHHEKRLNQIKSISLYTTWM